MKRCKICHSAVYAVDEAGRCRSCRIAKTAADMGTSYGKLKTQIYEQSGALPDSEPDIRQCPRCRKLFLRKHWNQKYCTGECAVHGAKKIKESQND